MFETELYISKLIYLHFRGELSADERAQLNNWLLSSEKNQRYFDQLTEDQSINNKLYKFNSINKTAVWEKVCIGIPDAQLKKPTAPIHKIPGLYYRIATIAALFILIFSALYFYPKKGDDTQNLKDGLEIKAIGNQATLTLSNGQKILLSSFNKGQIAAQAGNISIVKTGDGQVSYIADKTGDAKSHEHVNTSNMLATANGEQYQLILPDGSKVWMNAGSVLKFPSTFEGLKAREVELSGEAYFEIASILKPGAVKEHLPFIVHTKNHLVEVLGTHFNVNAYPDEPLAKTTLLEGAVKITTNTQQVSILPKQQAIINKEQIKVLAVDPNLDVAWKDGGFIFKQDDLKSAMRKIARWYNVEIVYDGFDSADYIPGGWISRSKNLAEVLKIMESTGLVHFKIQGRRVYVTK